VRVFHETSKHLVGDGDRYGSLIFTGKRRSGNRTLVREPEARHLLALTLQQANVLIGLEVPTTERYAFTTSRPDSANVDLGIDPGDAQVNVELKTGQPGVPKIAKDFRKIISEKASGCAFYHVLEDADSGTFPSLLAKYGVAFQQALNQTDTALHRRKWFVHYILVRRRWDARWQTWGDILEVQRGDFAEVQYKQVRTR